MNIKQILIKELSVAMESAGVGEEVSPSISSSKHLKNGDFQVNGLLAAAKVLQTNPKKLAEKVVAKLNLSEQTERIEVSGPGFINIHLSNQWISDALDTLYQKNNLGIEKVVDPQTIVVDYSAPNLAKEMHVGHLRSTIIGDAQVRLLEFLGHKVIRQNHIGDWGTQFGMLIAELEQVIGEEQLKPVELKDLEAFYQQSKKHFDESESFAKKAREYVVKLQAEDPKVLELWKRFIKLSLAHTEIIYQKLNVSLGKKDVMGESAYNNDLPVLVEDLKAKGLVTEDDGAIVAFLNEFSEHNNHDTPIIVQKQGGGYLYATTDLAAIRYRVNELNADSILYFIDVRQSLHLSQVFALAKKAGFAPEKVQLKHCAFGTMKGKDGKPFKTRSGGVVKLESLLDEAIGHAKQLLQTKENKLSEEEMLDVVTKVGIGAIKYADLSKTRTNDYIFDWQSMLNLKGNTAPYLQYAYTRIKSLFRESGINPEKINSSILITNEYERALAIKLLSFEEVLIHASIQAMPHIICTYLFELAKIYMTFYEECPILKNDIEKDIQLSRLKLCAVTANVFKTSLNILGIEVMEKM